MSIRHFYLMSIGKFLAHQSLFSGSLDSSRTAFNRLNLIPWEATLCNLCASMFILTNVQERLRSITGTWHRPLLVAHSEIRWWLPCCACSDSSLNSCKRRCVSSHGDWSPDTNDVPSSLSGRWGCPLIWSDVSWLCVLWLNRSRIKQGSDLSNLSDLKVQI